MTEKAPFINAIHLPTKIYNYKLKWLDLWNRSTMEKTTKWNSCIGERTVHTNPFYFPFVQSTWTHTPAYYTQKNINGEKEQACAGEEEREWNAPSAVPRTSIEINS